MKNVTVKLINHGGYDGLKHLEFPIEVQGKLHEVLGYIDVSMSELERIGYDKVKGQIAEFKDCAEGSDGLTFFQGGEAVVIG